MSTAEQNPDHQIDALLRLGVARENIHIDKASGAKASRPKLDLVLQLLREGDTLEVTRLDRLSRSVQHLINLGADLRERKIGLHVIEQDIETDTAEGRAMFGMLSVFTELQRELIIANTNDGPAAPAYHRAGHPRPRAVRRAGQDCPADRWPVRRAPLHRLRPPRQVHHRAAPAEEDRYEAVAVSFRSTASGPWTVVTRPGPARYRRWPFGYCSRAANPGRAMGALSAARSTGTFVANLAMGLLYSVSVSLAYGYAAAPAAVAGFVVLGSLPTLRAWQRRRDGPG